MGWPTHLFSFKHNYNMASCTSKLTASLKVDTAILINGVIQAILIPSKSIASVTYATPDDPNSVITAISLVEGADPHAWVDGYKNSIKVVTSAKVGEYSTALSTAVSFKLYPNTSLAQTQAVLNGDWCVLTVNEDGVTRLYGYGSPLQCSTVDGSTDTGNVMTITLSTPESSTGEYPKVASSEVYRTLQASALA